MTPVCLAFATALLRQIIHETVVFRWRYVVLPFSFHGSYAIGPESQGFRDTDRRASAPSTPARWLNLPASDDVEARSLYLTVTGTSAGAGDDGQVCRGNRVNARRSPGEHRRAGCGSPRGASKSLATSWCPEQRRSTEVEAKQVRNSTGLTDLDQPAGVYQGETAQ